MYKKTIKFEDCDGNEVVKDFYFNLNKGEIIELQNSVEGGLDSRLTKIGKAQKEPELMEVVRELILKSYGVKGEDNIQFLKSKELRDAFANTDAYSNLLYELVSDPKAVDEFVQGILPKDWRKQAAEAMLKATKPNA